MNKNRLLLRVLKYLDIAYEYKIACVFLYVRNTIKYDKYKGTFSFYII